MILRYNTPEEEMEFIVQQITSLNLEDVGILVPTNSHVDIIEKYLLQKDVVCEGEKGMVG